jgi:lysylphosphatidylglycerol synthetase-like protein (DUF2156 family)
MLAPMQVAEARPGYELWRPNREKAECKTMKAVVAFVLLVSAGLLLVITIGGWERLLGTSVAVMTILWAALYVLFAFMVVNWSRGILPVASALAVLMLIFAAVSAPGWFARDKEGLDSPAIPEELIGLLVVIVIPVQLLLVAVAMFGFNQDWHVEEERPVDGEYEDDERERYADEDDERRYDDRA